MEYNQYPVDYNFKSEEEIEDMDGDEVVNYLLGMGQYNYYTGNIFLTDEYIELLDDKLENSFDDEEYLIYIKQFFNEGDIFVLEDMDYTNKYEYPKAFLLYEYNSRVTYEYKKWEEVYYYDYDGFVDMIKEVEVIPSHLEDYIDYDKWIRDLDDGECYYITGDDGNYEGIYITEL